MLEPLRAERLTSSVGVYSIMATGNMTNGAMDIAGVNGASVESLLCEHTDIGTDNVVFGSNSCINPSAGEGTSRVVSYINL